MAKNSNDQGPGLIEGASVVYRKSATFVTLFPRVSRRSEGCRVFSPSEHKRKEKPPGEKDDEQDIARWSSRRMVSLEKDFKSLQDLVQTLKVDRDMREAQKKRAQVRR